VNLDADPGLLFAKSSAFDLARLLEPREGLVDFLPGKDLPATGALVDFFGESFIYEVVGEIDRVKKHGEIVDFCEILVLASVTQEIVLATIHQFPPRMKATDADVIKRPLKGVKKKRAI
jgi:hypothetical protein